MLFGFCPSSPHRFREAPACSLADCAGHLPARYVGACSWDRKQRLHVVELFGRRIKFRQARQFSAAGKKYIVQGKVVTMLSFLEHRQTRKQVKPLNAIVPIVKEADKGWECSLSINELQHPTLFTGSGYVTLADRDRNERVSIHKEEMSKFAAESVPKDIIWEQCQDIADKRFTNRDSPLPPFGNLKTPFGCAVADTLVGSK